MNVRIHNAASRFHLYRYVTELNATTFQKELVAKIETDHGLRFTKFFGRWRDSSTPELRKKLSTRETRAGRQPVTNPGAATDPVLDWLDPRETGDPYRIPGHAFKTLNAGNEVQLEHALVRLQRLATKRGACVDLDLVSRLLIGIGLPHPIENGFLFHPTLGVPYVPGTALKQVAQDWAEENGVPREELNQLFGAEDHGAGRVAFLDALPCGRVTLTAEQITNHYKGYYQNVVPGEPINNEMHQPADWYEPIPVTLLALDASLAKPQSFRFGIVRLRDATDNDFKKALEWLTLGLEVNGVGARTTLGFGRFEGQGGRERREALLAGMKAKAAPVIGEKVRILNTHPKKKHHGQTGTLERISMDTGTPVAFVKTSQGGSIQTAPNNLEKIGR